MNTHVAHHSSIPTWEIRSTVQFLRELALFFVGIIPMPHRPVRLSDVRRRWRERRATDKRRVRLLLLPGFLATDHSMRRLRFHLRRAGHRAHGWGLGRNEGVGPDLMDRLDRRVRALSRSDERLVLVGWSLGGLIAREYAKQAPDRVAAVITMGSPFGADIRTTFIWRFYNWMTRNRDVRPFDPEQLAEKPPVPTIALWSPCDGLIPSVAARGESPHVDGCIRVQCAHMTYPTDRTTIDAVVEAVDAIAAGTLHHVVDMGESEQPEAQAALAA
ncbi:esterase/lipase family protein [Sphingosinithalassobacter portus]|uniref:esterase/lipase family protein n=1 Tax=Stakelama portus TaxID=2676234 RepID=UPI000D6E258A|nr:alpha/beta fold hydrolase [Sphingosinithalassobacter portus]